jgi:SlyX protein
LSQIALDFDVFTFDSASDTTFLLEDFGQRLQFGLRQGQAGDNCHRLAATSLGFTLQADNAITGRGRAGLAAHTTGYRAVTLGAEAPGISGINKAGIFLFAHGAAVYFCRGRQYISQLIRRQQIYPEGATVTETEEIRQQLLEVQTQLAFQEDTLRELNDALALQQQEILVLRRQLQLLKQRQDEQLAGQVPGETEEKPPHY